MDEGLDMDYRKEIQELRRTLTENGYLYYVLDAPTMSDYEYDHLLRRLEDLASYNSIAFAAIKIKRIK